MKKQVYVHAEGNRDPKLLEVPDNATIADILQLYKAEFPNDGSPDEIEIFLENEGGPVPDNSSLPHRGHIHCHRCKKIDVSFIYNGDEKMHSFSPSATAGVILKVAVHLFGISEHDAGDYLLKIDDKIILQPADHIGSFAKFPRCHVKLFLTATKPVQGNL